MKKVLYILLVLVLFLSSAACENNGSSSNGSNDPSTSSGDPSPGSDAPIAMPTSAVLPNTLHIDDIFNLINQNLDTEDDNFMFHRDYAVFYPAIEGLHDDELYIFDIGELEAVFFTNAETGFFLSCYFRSRYDHEVILMDMVTLAAMTLSVLEPNECERMLFEIKVLVYPDTEEEEIDEDAIFISSGEVWTIINEGSLININPTA